MNSRGTSTLVVALLACVLDGAFRKWVWPDPPVVVAALSYLSKSVLLAYAGLVIARSRSPQFATAHQAAFVMILVGAALSSSQLFAVRGAIQTMLHCLVMPAAAWRLATLLTRDDALSVLRIAAVSALPLSILAVAQYTMPADHEINRYVEEGAQITTASVSDRVRATGTFSYISGLSEYATFVLWASGVLALSSVTRGPRTGLWIVCLFASVACGFATVSRATFAACLLLSALVLIPSVVHRRGVLAASGVLIGLALLFKPSVLEFIMELGGVAVERHNIATDTVDSRVADLFLAPIDTGLAYPIGVGLGGEFGGDFSGDVYLNTVAISESPWARSILQIGVIGLLGYVVLLLLSIRRIIRLGAARNHTAVHNQSILILSAAALAIRAAWGPQFNHVASFLYWLQFALACAVLRGATPVDLQQAAASSEPAGYGLDG